MALTVKNNRPEGYRLVRLIDSINDNPLELTMGATNDGRISLHLEDRDAGTMSDSLILETTELQAALAVLNVERGVFIED